MKTTSYEISKKLKEAGFTAETEYYWYCYDNGREMRHIADADGKGDVEAYDLETLLDALPKKLANKYGKNGALKLSYDTKVNWIYYADKEDYILFFNDYAYCEIKSQENESFADTAGRLLLLLHEKNLIKF